MIILDSTLTLSRDPISKSALKVFCKKKHLLEMYFYHDANLWSR